MSARNLSRLVHLAVVLIMLLPSGAAAAKPQASGASTALADTVVVPAGGKIQIAVTMDFANPDYQDLFDAAQLAMDDFGPVKGFVLQKNNYNSGCSEVQGAAAGTAILAESQNVGVIGPYCSVSTMGAAPLFEAAGLVMISPTNTFPDLYNYGPNVFNRVVVEDPEFDAWNEQVSQLPSVLAWEADFESTHGHAPAWFARFGYEAATLLLKRIEQVSKAGPVGSLVIDRAALATAVRNSFQVAGVSGSITLDAYGTRIHTGLTGVWHDPFGKSTLGEAWTWIDEDPTHWSLTARPGFLRIVTQDPYPNRLVRAMPAEDFEMRTRLLFEPTENYQFAGLLVFEDENNLLNFGRAFCDPSHVDCVGNGIYFDYIQNGVRIGSNFATPISTAGEVYLRLVRQGEWYTGYASPNGTQWTVIGGHEFEEDPAGIGLYANNQALGDAEINADFDFFLLEFELSRVFLPLAMGSE